MVVIIFVALLGLSFWRKKSPIIFALIMLFMWSVATFCYGIADEELYMSRYYEYDVWSNLTEYGFGLLIKLCSRLNMTFVEFKGVLFALVVLLTSSTVYKFSKFPNLVLCFFFICPFPLNVAQMRNALATAFMIYAIRYLFESDSKHRKLWKFELNDIKFIIVILIATLIHTASLLWLLLLVAKKCNVRTNIIVMLTVNVLLMFVLTPSSLERIASLFGAGERINAYFSKAYATSGWKHYGPVVYLLYSTGITLILCNYIRVKQKKNKNIVSNEIILCQNLNIISLCIIALIFRYTSEVRRIHEGLTIINYILLTNAIDNKNFGLNKISKSDFLLICIMVLFVGSYAWLILIHYLNNTVWIPFWFNNYLWEFF